MPGTSFLCVNCRSDWRSEAMFLVQMSNEITLFNHQLDGRFDGRLVANWRWKNGH